MKLITIKFSPAQIKALREMEEVTGKNKSELIRIGLATMSEAFGVYFPQNVAKRGRPYAKETLILD